MATAAIGAFPVDPEKFRKDVLEYWNKTIGEENVKKYQGKYVGTVNEDMDEIVASGDSPDEVVEEAKKKNLLPIHITFIPK